VRTLAASLAAVLVGALVACTPTGPIEAVEVIELDVTPVAVPDAAPPLPDDPGGIPFATVELLDDYVALTGETVDVAGLLEAERLAGEQLRAALDEPDPAAPPEASAGAGPSAGAATVGADAASADARPAATAQLALATPLLRSPTESGGAGESLVVGMLTTGLLVPAMQGAWWARDLKIGQSSGRIGDAQTAAARSSGETEVRRTGANELSVAIQQESTSADGVTTRNRLTQEGKVCPGDDGEFDFTVKLEREVTGPGGTVREELTVRVTGRLGEDGYPESMAIDATQATREAPAGKQAIYVETRQTLPEANVLDVILVSQQPAQLVRSSSGATSADVRRLAARASARLGALSWGSALGSVTGMWSNGCVGIEATAPATVPPRSGLEIPVTVRSKLSAEEFGSAVTAALTGSDSVAPDSFRSTSTITFVAGEAGTRGTILLKAASRRGTATKELTISTGGRAYLVEGTNGDVFASGVICDLSSRRSFELVGTGTVTTFSPNDDRSGTFRYVDDGTYGQGLIELDARGSYTIALEPDGLSGRLTTTGTGRTAIDGPLGRQEFEFPANLTYTMTAIEGTPDECVG